MRFSLFVHQFRSKEQYNEVAEEWNQERNHKVGTVGNDAHKQETTAPDWCHHQQGSSTFLEIANDKMVGNIMASKR